MEGFVKRVYIVAGEVSGLLGLTYKTATWGFKKGEEMLIVALGLCAKAASNLRLNLERQIKAQEAFMCTGQAYVLPDNQTA